MVKILIQRLKHLKLKIDPKSDFCNSNFHHVSSNNKAFVHTDERAKIIGGKSPIFVQNPVFRIDVQILK